MSEPDLRSILEEAERIAVLGWSPKASRDAKQIADYLDEVGYEVLPVNPNYEGRQAYGTSVAGNLTELEDIDIVDVFRRSEAVVTHVPEALELAAPVFWMQLGVRSEQAREQLEAAGITVLEDLCIKVEHRRLLG